MNNFANQNRAEYYEKETHRLGKLLEISEAQKDKLKKEKRELKDYIRNNLSRK